MHQIAEFAWQAVLAATTGITTIAAAGQSPVCTSLPCCRSQTIARPIKRQRWRQRVLFSRHLCRNMETETYDEDHRRGLRVPPIVEALIFGASGITGVAEFSGVFSIPRCRALITTPQALVEQPPVPAHPSAYNNDITLSQPVTAFGSYFIQAGDQAANTLTRSSTTPFLGLPPRMW